MLSFFTWSILFSLRNKMPYQNSSHAKHILAKLIISLKWKESGLNRLFLRTLLIFIKILSFEKDIYNSIHLLFMSIFGSWFLIFIFVPLGQCHFQHVNHPIFMAFRFELKVSWFRVAVCKTSWLTSVWLKLASSGVEVRPIYHQKWPTFMNLM